ncbi:hypothetical protein [Azohydromonas australica]|uniref:hypothetical protein n=1 Tax=Azohydromonas australica TaxID=364039 RepID=UPI0003F84B79
MVQAQFSSPYTVAAAPVDGGVQLAHFFEAALQHTDPQTMAAWGEPHVDEEVERE